jgi:hypothetical protein
MRNEIAMVVLVGMTGAGLFGAAAWGQVSASEPGKLADPAGMAKVGVVDERFQSFNMEMVEVTGGRFWKPYASVDAEKAAAAKGAAPGADSKPGSGNQPVGMAASLYEYRPPVNLSNARLRKLAKELSPMYLRVSGTWANSTYFNPEGTGADEAPPAGFKGVLTGAEWRGVVDFTKAAHAELVTSFATSAGVRDAEGVWTPKEAAKIVAFTRNAGGHIAAAEMMNEPTFAEIGGAPKGYDAAAFARDIAVFEAFAKKDAKGMLVLGPGGVGEGASLTASGNPMPGMHLLASEDLMKATGPVFDVFSYHSYGGVSSRCGGSTTLDAALSDAWLKKADTIEQFYAALRDKYEPGKPLWNTETGQTACGGDRWASTFADSFRYLDQLGDLAKRGVQVQMHNTLAASDYGLLDEKTYEPRPNYWAALLWHKLMGTTVLDAGSVPGVRLYAHCLQGVPGGVAVIAIATGSGETALEVPESWVRYKLTAHELTSRTVELNGNELALGDGDALPAITGTRVKAGVVSLPGRSLTFLAFPGAGNAACK